MEASTKIIAPEQVIYIINTLNQKGYEAYAVGGCVRDSLLGRAPKDWDITTNARPEIVKGFFEKTVDTGLKHGTVTVVLDHENYEVTTYRIDGKYLDNRHPESVQFTTSLTEDLSRRDFTINAIAWHPELGTADPFEGLKDIQSRIIRAVGMAEDRFEEDALRMMRAVRFSAQLDFRLEKDTLRAISKKCHLIDNISSERIRDELTKTLVSDNPMKLLLMRDTGLLPIVLPELESCFDTVQNNPYHVYNVGMHIMHSVQSIENDPVLRWAMLLHDIGKPAAKTTDVKNIDHFYGHPQISVRVSKKILQRLKLDNKSIDRICRLIEHHDRDFEATHRSVRKTLKAVGEDIFINLLKIMEADKKAQNPEYLEKRLSKFQKAREIYNDIMEKNECITLTRLALDGNDLIAIGFTPGKEIGKTLNKLLDIVIDAPELNTRDALTELALKTLEDNKRRT